jgi:hypothetical protein
MEVESEDWLAPRLRCVVNDSTLVLIDMGMIRFLCSVDFWFGSLGGFFLPHGTLLVATQRPLARAARFSNGVPHRAGALCRKEWHLPPISRRLASR